MLILQFFYSLRRFFENKNTVLFAFLLLHKRGGPEEDAAMLICPCFRKPNRLKKVYTLHGKNPATSMNYTM